MSKGSNVEPSIPQCPSCPEGAWMDIWSWSDSWISQWISHLLNKPSLLTSIENLREGYERLRRVVAIVPGISVKAVAGRTPYQWLTYWLGQRIAILGTLSAKTLSLSSATQARNFLMTVRRGDATVFIAVTSIAFVLVQCDDVCIPHVLWYFTLYSAETGFHTALEMMFLLQHFSTSVRILSFSGALPEARE